MATMKYGEVSWTDAAGGGGDEARPNGRDLFLRLNPGSNVVRILTRPYQYYQHKYKFEGEKNWGHRIMCSGAHGSCPVCAKGDKAKRRWLLGVIDRKTNTYKILDIGYSVFKDLQTYTRDEDWGDPTTYDVDIVVDPKGGPQKYYSCVCKPKRPLSASDLDIRDRVMNLDELVRRVQPPEPVKVEERFQELMKEFLKSTDGGEKMKQSLAHDDEDDEVPDFNQSKTASREIPF